MYKVRYRVVLNAEDGSYLLKDNFLSYEVANQYALKISKNYGEGQQISIEDYNPYY